MFLSIETEVDRYYQRELDRHLDSMDNCCPICSSTGERDKCAVCLEEMCEYCSVVCEKCGHYICRSCAEEDLESGGYICRRNC